MFCYNITGKYDAEKHSRKEMEFVSNSTIGFVGQALKIAVERK